MNSGKDGPNPPDPRVAVSLVDVFSDGGAGWGVALGRSVD
jgi:hypothetical protein